MFINISSILQTKWFINMYKQCDGMFDSFLFIKDKIN